MSIKLLQIIAAYKPAYIYGGPTMSVSKLCEALTNAKIDVEVLTTTANGKSELNVKPGESMQIDGVKVTYFKRITKDHTHFSPALLLALQRKIKTNPNLIIHIHAWWNLVSIFSCYLAKWYAIPVILSPRGMLTNYTSKNRNGGIKSIIHTVIGKRLLKYCHIHVTSEKEKEDVLSIIQPKSITVIPNLVSFPAYNQEIIHHQQKENKEEPFKLIFLSRVEEKKGLELLFEAVVGLPFNWQLTIAGTGEEDYEKALKVRVERLKLSENINWIGQVSNIEKFILMAQHDLLVLTSYNENFANVVIESLSVGTPVLLSDQVGLADYVKEKKLGWITDLTPKNIKKNIVKSFEAVSSRLKIRETAPIIISEDFKSKNLIKKYFTLYSQSKNGNL
ncbi:MAG: glycosyltransferase [Bacteroidota bacterium]